MIQLLHVPLQILHEVGDAGFLQDPKFLQPIHIFIGDLAGSTEMGSVPSISNPGRCHGEHMVPLQSSWVSQNISGACGEAVGGLLGVWDLQGFAGLVIFGHCKDR